MKMRRVFKWAYHDDGGYYGWLPAWINCEHFDPSESVGVCHDFFEHRLADTGQFYQECMAFGAMVRVRVLGGYFTDMRIERLGEELAELWHRCGTPALEPCQRTCSVSDDAFDRLLVIKKGFKDQLEYLEATNELDEPVSVSLANDALLWMKVGYAQAHRRYRNIDPYYMAQLFMQLVRDIKNVTSEALRAETGEDLVAVNVKLILTLDDTRFGGDVSARVHAPGLVY